jgi:hypothetical protein
MVSQSSSFAVVLVGRQEELTGGDVHGWVHAVIIAECDVTIEEWKGLQYWFAEGTSRFGDKRINKLPATSPNLVFGDIHRVIASSFCFAIPDSFPFLSWPRMSSRPSPTQNLQVTIAFSDAGLSIPDGLSQKGTVL